MIVPLSIDHLVFRISALDQTERFYNALLGSPVHRDEETLMYIVDGTRIFFTVADEAEIGMYDKEISD